MSDDYGNSLRDSWDPIGYQRTQDLHKKFEKLQRVVALYGRELTTISAYHSRTTDCSSCDLTVNFICPECAIAKSIEETLAKAQAILSEDNK